MLKILNPGKIMGKVFDGQDNIVILLYIVLILVLTFKLFTMNLKTFVKQVIVVLNFPKVISNFIVYAKAIVMAMEGNPRFTALAAKVTKLKTDITALDVAETAFSTVPPTITIEDRDKALKLVKADLRSLRSDVQNIADADIENAPAIVASAGMSIKRDSTHKAPKNTAVDGSEEGSVNLKGEGAGPHDWRMSTDEKNWTLLPGSRTSTTSVSGLTAGTVYYFQNRRMLPHDVKTDWTPSVKFRVR